MQLSAVEKIKTQLTIIIRYN